MSSQLRKRKASWRLWLRAQNMSRETIRTYLAAVEQFICFLESPPDALDADVAALLKETPVADAPDIEPLHVQAFIAWVLENNKDSTANNRYRGLQQWFRWMTSERDIGMTVSPLVNMKPPTIPEQPIDVISIENLKKLLKTCKPLNKGKSQEFVARRDEAIIRLFCDTGMRRSEMAGLLLPSEIDGEPVPHIDMEDQQAWILRKGRKMRAVPFTSRTAVALDRYLRLREGDMRNRDLPHLWLQEKGKGNLTHWGIGQMIDRKCDAAGIPHVHPHQLRHTWAHQFRVLGGSEGDLKRLGGWKSRQMLDRYGGSAADERAKEGHKKYSLGNIL